MEKQYYVCIDYGHGETTASCIDITATYQLNKDGFYDVLKLNILNGSTDEARKVESVICRGEDGQWKFAIEDDDFSRPDLAMGFKKEVGKMSPEDKVYYKAFINLVFKAIIERNNFLKFDPKNPDNRNFELCIACPSAWGEDDARGRNSVIEGYKKFFSEALPIPVKFVIRESDAAFFKFIHLTNKNSHLKLLVIDLGSSTIDFTCYPYEEGKKYLKGAGNGASRVEGVTLDWCAKTQKEYKDAKSKIPTLLAQTSNERLNWEMACRHYIKIQKEDFYTKNRKKMMLNLQAAIPLGDQLADKLIAMGHCGDILYHCDIADEKLNEILNEYRSDLKDDLERLHASGAEPEMILLTGGASRMPWVKGLVEDVFHGAQVHCDSNPSYVVSDGIAMYAYADHKFRIKLAEMAATIKSEFTEEKLVEEIRGALNDAMKEVQLPPMLKICNDFVAGTFVTLQALLDRIEEHNNNIVGDNAPRIKRQISDQVCKKLENTIFDRINEIFRECFRTTRSVSFDLDWNGVDFSGLFIDSSGDKDAVQGIGTGLFCQGFFGGVLDLAKPRTPDERKQFDTQFREYQNTAQFGMPDSIKSPALNACNRAINTMLSTIEAKGLFSTY